MFQSAWINDIIAAAKANGIEPAALLAVVEVESRGKAFEADGTTPCFLFERHIFHRELARRAPSKLAAAEAQGLAHKGWRAGQYKDQGSSNAKLALLARARALDPTCADRACSWGLGQVLGCNAEMLGFPSVAEMMQSLRTGRVAAQIDLMVRFIKANKLSGPLARGDWVEFARRYNGPGFRKNRYDEKLAAAHAKWAQFLTGLDGHVLQEETSATGPLASGSRGERVERLQSALKALGYAVGEIDGLYGPATQAAVAAFQRDRGLPVSGSADEATLQALQDKPSQPDDLLRLLLEAILRPADQGKSPPSSPPSSDPAPPILSPIDRMIGGEMLAGKKTLLAVLAYVALALGQATGGIGTATGDDATPTGQILTSLIAAFGGLGLISKGDRAVQMLGRIAAEPPAEPPA